jgi:hypothetical protein
MAELRGTIALPCGFWSPAAGPALRTVCVTRRTERRLVRNGRRADGFAAATTGTGMAAPMVTARAACVGRRKAGPLDAKLVPEVAGVMR